ncbi:MAG: Mpv17/PMP22 family protein [Bacteroidetes bacterium]|nr:Mpv17/PMP22 family protein [Bacteroidota bacterium]
MKKNDFLVIGGVILLFLPFFVFSSVFGFYENFNKIHPMIMSFIKFAILATLGESIGLRIKEGRYNYRGFGLLPRAIVWGFLGLTIQMAFVIFSQGIPVFLTKTLGLDFGKSEEMTFGSKLLIAFCISAAMNIIYAPVMMTLHKITDLHIINNGGTVNGLLQPIKMGEIMSNINWNVQWNFVFKKTIPFFWIPAHTITFMLPPEYRVLFAALLGIALGVILSLAAIKGKSK